MKKGLIKFIGVVAILLPSILLTFADVKEALSLEPLVVKEETVEKVYEKIDVVEVADNVIILFDASSSMSDLYKSTGMRKIQVEKKILKERIENSFENDLNIGLYSFSDKLRTFYAMQPFRIGDGPPEPFEITSNQLKTPPKYKLKPIILTPK